MSSSRWGRVRGSEDNLVPGRRKKNPAPATGPHRWLTRPPAKPSPELRRAGAGPGNVPQQLRRPCAELGAAARVAGAGAGLRSARLQLRAPWPWPPSAAPGWNPGL